MSRVTESFDTGTFYSTSTSTSTSAIGCRSVHAVLLTTILLFGLPANAAWDYGVDIDLGIIRSDNILLAPRGEELSETVFTIAPQFYLTADEELLQADIRYRPEAYFYSELDAANDIFHVLDATLTGTIVRDRLFLALSGTNFQSIVTPDGQIPTSNLPISTNRTDSTVLEARPYWQQRVGDLDFLAQLAYFDIDYDDPQFQSSNERHAYTSLGNIERQQGFAWQADYRFRRTEYETSEPWEFQRAALNLGFWVGGGLRLFAVGGAETSFDDIFESNLDADFWEAGFQYAPSQRLNIEVAAGDRSYGSSFRGDISYVLRRGELAVIYGEGPTNRSELAFNDRPINDTDDLDGVLDRPGDSDRFVRKRGEFSATIDLAKSELSLRVFSENREDRTTADGSPLDEEALAGAALRWRWRFGSRTSLGLGADYAKRDQAGVEDKLHRGQLDIQYQVSQRMSLRLETARSRQVGITTSDYDYEENQYRLLLRTSL